MQIVVLGMHRSGTSVLARLLNMAGAYFGPEGVNTGQSEQNPKGFWERRDVRDINDEILEAIGCDWDQLQGFDLGRLNEKARKSVEQAIRGIVLELDAHRPWFIKEPRLSLTLPLWRTALELPVAVVTRRHPIEIAESLRTRNGFPLSLGLALWEVYTIHLLRELRGIPAVYVDHANLLEKPNAEFGRTVADLASLGISGLRIPTKEEIAAFVDPALYRSRNEGVLLLSEHQQKLWAYFSGLKLHTPIEHEFELSTDAERDLAAYQASVRLHLDKLQTARVATITAEALSKLRTELSEAKEMQARDQSRLIDALARFQAARAERKRLKQEGEELAAKLRDATAALDLAFSREADLKRELEQAVAEKVNLQQCLVEKENLGVQNTNALLVKEDLLAKHRQTMAEAEARVEAINSLRSELDGTRKQIAEFKKNLAQRDKKIEIMRTGISWRITAPLRAVGFCLQGLINKAAAKPAPPKKSSTGQIENKPNPKVPVVALANVEIDVIVCVHNALDDVRRCLESVARNRTPACRVILVNDGSNMATSSYLKEFAGQTSNVMLLSSKTARGYTKAVNHGLSASKAPHVILLNSDTIVPSEWIQRLLACALSDSKLGIVGPVSNAATWQSVPSVRSARGGWAINSLPAGRTVEDMAQLTAKMSNRRYPRVPLLNGFCLLIKKEVFAKIGAFDEAAFPRGYGEENDFCLRATAVGYKLAVADDCYVYHAKSKSYTSSVRNELVAATKRTLEERYGTKTFKDAAAALQANPDLGRLRARIEAAVDRRPPWPETFSDASLRILFLLPCMGKGGGVLSILQESYGMVRRGVEARVAVYEKHLAEYLEYFTDYPAQLFVPFKTQDDLAALVKRFNVAVATIYSSVPLLKDVLPQDSHLLPAYYIQDYEPFFFDPNSDEYHNARESYTAIPEMVRFAKTNWIRETVLNREGVTVDKVQASVDHSVFYPLGNRPTGDILEVCAMVRPQTPRRAAKETVEVLRSLKQRLGEIIRITVFGCENGDPAFADLRIDFELINKGILPRTDVASLLRNSDLFIDMSTYQAFGRTAVEAMASGCAAVVPGKSGAEEFAVHLENALIVDTTRSEQTADQIEALLRDPALLAKLKRNGLETAMRYTVQEAVYSILNLFSRRLQERSA